MGSPSPGLHPRQGLHPLSISLRHGAPRKAQLSPLLGDPPSSRVAVLPSPDGHAMHLGATHSGRGSSGVQRWGRRLPPQEATLPIPTGRGTRRLPLGPFCPGAKPPKGEARVVMLDTWGTQDRPGAPTPSELQGADGFQAPSHPRNGKFPAKGWNRPQTVCSVTSGLDPESRLLLLVGTCNCPQQMTPIHNCPSTCCQGEGSQEPGLCMGWMPPCGQSTGAGPARGRGSILPGPSPQQALLLLPAHPRLALPLSPFQPPRR